MKGRLITFEGLDFSGKSVQARFLQERLEGMNQSVVFLREPGGTEISEQIRLLLLDENNRALCSGAELLLYAAARAQAIHERIDPALNTGKTVLIDRYYDSTLAYQGYGRQIDLEFINKLNTFVVQNSIPDLTFLLDVKPEVASKRASDADAGLDRLEQEDIHFRTRIRAGYLQLARTEPSRFVVIDGNRAIDTIKEDIFDYTREKFGL